VVAAPAGRHIFCEGRVVRELVENNAARPGVLEELQYEQHHHDYHHDDYHRADHPSPPPRTGSPAKHGNGKAGAP
jgi:hypothetical protein